MAWPYTVTNLTPTDSSAQLGATVLGEAVFNQPVSLEGSIQVATISGFNTVTLGHKQFYRRGYSRPISYPSRRRPTPVGPRFPFVSIISSTGALIGRIRSDVQKTIIHSLEFTVVKGDCRDFVLELTELPPFPLAPFSIIQINVGNSENNWFIGKITDQEDVKSKTGSTFKFKGQGLTGTDIKDLVFDDDLNFTATLDVGEIVDSIVQTQIAPFTFVRYNPSKIDTSTGVLTANEIQPSKANMPKFLDAMGKMANCDWGVDGDGDFFFLPITTSVVKTFFVGWQLNEFTPKLNLQAVKNSIFLQRQQGKGSGGAGWAVAGIKNNDTSIAKYGLRELKFQAPGFFSDNDLDIVGDQLLSDLSEPKFSGTANGYQAVVEADYIQRGVHRFILPFQRYTQLYNDVENASLWTGDSGITITNETDLFVFGSSAIKVACVSASGGHIELTQAYNGRIQRVIIWVRSTLQGNYLTAGIGLASWNQYTVPLAINVQDTFFAFEWDVSALNLTKIDKIGIGIDTNEAFDLYVDKIEFVVDGFPYYKITSSKQTYKFQPGINEVSMEFDKVPSKMEDYINNILAIAEENRFTGEVR